MNVSLEWLSEYVTLPAELSELENVLTRSGLSVEAVIQRGGNYSDVVVAEVLESDQHPNADRLSVCQVDDGTGTPRQIVCGAKNYKVGDKVPLALPGAVLPGNFKIKAGKLRGEKSEGMMCSAKELELAEDAAGLLILPESSKPGTPISALFPPDTCLKLEITPNRADWLGHIGIAREVAAFTGNNLTLPSIPEVAATGSSGIAIDEACPLYSLRKVTGVKVADSPDWLKRRLQAIGLRPINNIVDITNYVMMETGQPLHAFDAAKVVGEISVRKARQGEVLTALDGQEYELTPSDLVIADSEKVLAIAGVMGGEESGVTGETTEILLESAEFAPASVRRTSRTLELSSDSSYRFERGVDSEGVLRSSTRAVELVQSLAGGEAGKLEYAGQLSEPRNSVRLDLSSVRRLLGIALEDEQLVAALQSFGLKTEDKLHWHVPSFRRDLTRPVDLIEEVARAIGIEAVPSVLRSQPSPVTVADQVYDRGIAIRQLLAARGLHECRTGTLVPAHGTERPSIRLANPMGEEGSCLRPALYPSLLGVLERNLRNDPTGAGLFELGRTYAETGEFEHLCIVVSGPTKPADWQRPTPTLHDIHSVLGLLPARVFEVGNSIQMDGFPLAATLKFGDEPVGFVAQLDPAKARKLGARFPVYVAEVSVSSLPVSEPLPAAQLISPYPASSRDLAIVAEASLPYCDILKAIEAAKEPLLVSITPLSVYSDLTGKALESHLKSVAISLTFQSSERTLEAKEVQKATERIKASLKTSLAVNFRE